ncbi:type II toxin-antitoxin system RelE/ParE family toxin [Microbacterium karelineae]|uniref:type II toxin-antitoxin system RelE/ParE family toxin n=1 Tax=Microbacterium karelineae TaxID=2654283 RepID=UPI0012E9A2B4|nr:type II toxin-antitoxin system RelE/ParE family toxin [Microbacterium karelineae]
MTARAVVYARRAAAQLEEAVAWYAQQAPDQVTSFLADEARARARIASFPRIAPALHGPVRAASLTRFPYTLWYRIRDEEVLEIIAVAHHKADVRRVLD